MGQITEAQIRAGQAIYSKLMLSIYNLWVLDISNSFIWRCSKKIQLNQYQKFISNKHLDIGVGTGYYLKHSHWDQHTQLALMDLNPNSLAAAKKSTHTLSPHLYEADIFKTQTSLAEQFSSISMNYLLHCLPGDMNNKVLAIQNAVAMLKPGGVLFGATIISDDNHQTRTSRKLANFYNKKGIFSNQNDTAQALKNALKLHLDDVELTIHGCVALFCGYKKSTP